MKVWKLVSGILSIVFSVFIIAQIMLMGLPLYVLNGLFIAGLMLAAGIVSIVFWKKQSRGCDIALIVLFFVAVLLGACKYIDLNIWATWCLACGIVTFVRFVRETKPKEVKEEPKTEEVKAEPKAEEPKGEIKECPESFFGYELPGRCGDMTKEEIEANKDIFLSKAKKEESAPKEEQEEPAPEKPTKKPRKRAKKKDTESKTEELPVEDSKETSKDAESDWTSL